MEPEQAKNAEFEETPRACRGTRHAVLFGQKMLLCEEVQWEDRKQNGDKMES